MESVQLTRRAFLARGLTGLGLFAAGGSVRYRALAANSGWRAPFASLEAIGELLPPDANGVRLPKGFSARIVARSGQAPAGLPGYTWHSAPDGGACFAAEDGGWIYVSNSEISSNGGGVGALRFDAEANVVDAYSILNNTSINCAGGPTPWGTWLSCEEFDAGQVYECDPSGRTPARLRAALGTFKHEAVTVDLANNCLYLTEDLPDGGFYRFRPERQLPYLETGQLEIASVQRRGGDYYIEWLPVPDPRARRTPTRHQVAAMTPFAGGEGIGLFGDKVHFTTKHDNRVWTYNSATSGLSVLYDFKTSETPVLSGVDNVVITATGDVVVAEDKGNMQLVALTPGGRVTPIVQLMDQAASEITGPAFDPTYQRLYFSSQRGTLGIPRGGLTYEIRYTG
jgi:hypothetical protein